MLGGRAGKRAWSNNLDPGWIYTHENQQGLGALLIKQSLKRSHKRVPDMTSTGTQLSHHEDSRHFLAGD